METPEYQAGLRFIELTLEKRALRARMDAIDKKLKTLEPALVGYLSAAALPEFVVENYLLYPQRQPWVYPRTGVSRQTVCEALKISGLARMVSENYSTTALTRYVKDLEDHHKLITELAPDGLDKLLPPALAHILNIKAAFHIRVKEKKAKKEQLLYTDDEEYEPGDEAQ